MWLISLYQVAFESILTLLNEIITQSQFKQIDSVRAFSFYDLEKNNW